MRIFTHPLRDGVTLILEKHFAPEIVKRFKLIFEANAFHGQNIVNQIRNDKVALEVYYQEGDATEYICDVWSYMNTKQAEYHLLNRITDAWKAKKIGKNWNLDTGDEHGRVSEIVASGQLETVDPLEKGGE